MCFFQCSGSVRQFLHLCFLQCSVSVRQVVYVFLSMQCLSETGSGCVSACVSFNAVSQ